MARKSKNVEVAPKNVEDAVIVTAAKDYPIHHVPAKELEVEFDDRTIANDNVVEGDLDLAISIAIYGQQQPVVAYKNPVDEKFYLVAGRTRTRAIARLNDGFDAIDPRSGEKARFHAPDLKVWVAECPQSDKATLFVTALGTNIKQKALSIVQEAYAVKVLTEKHQYTLTDAARLFGYSNTNRQSRLLRLLDNQPTEVIDRVHSGQLSLDAAISLEVIEDRAERLSLLEQASNAKTGRVDGGLLRRLLRDRYQSAGENEQAELDAAFGFSHDFPKATDEGDGSSSRGGSDDDAGEDEPTRDQGINLKRSAADLRKAIAGFVGNEEEPATDGQKEFFKVLIKYLDGTKSETSLVNAINKYIA